MAALDEPVMFIRIKRCVQKIMKKNEKGIQQNFANFYWKVNETCAELVKFLRRLAFWKIDGLEFQFCTTPTNFFSLQPIRTCIPLSLCFLDELPKYRQSEQSAQLQVISICNFRKDYKPNLDNMDSWYSLHIIWNSFLHFHILTLLLFKCFW